MNTWPVNLDDRDGRLAQLNLRSHKLMKCFESSARQVQSFGKRHIVKLLEVKTQNRIHLGLSGEWLERISVADAFLFDQPNRKKNEWRVKALWRFLFQVRPTQETQDQPQLGKTELQLIALCFRANVIEKTRQIDRLFETQILI